MAIVIVPSTEYTDSDMLTAITKALALSARANEITISTIVLGIIRADGALSKKEFAEQFMPALPAPKHRTYDEVRNQRNRLGKYFFSAQRAFGDNEDGLVRKLNKRNDRTMEADIAFIEAYLWRDVSDDGKYKSEAHMLARTAPDAKAPREEDEKVKSMVNAFIKNVKTRVLTQDQCDAIAAAITAAVMRGLNVEEPADIIETDDARPLDESGYREPEKLAA